MKKEKKGSIVPIGIFIFLIVVAVLIPVVGHYIRGQRYQGCDSTNLTTYNSTHNLCFDGVLMDTNTTTQTLGLSTGDYTILTVGVLFFALGAVFVVIKKLGLI